MNISLVGGRKFILCLMIMVINAVLVYMGVITPQLYTNIVISTATLYIGGNVGQKVLAKQQ